jgi:hypothetical protein
MKKEYVSLQTRVSTRMHAECKALLASARVHGGSERSIGDILQMFHISSSLRGTLTQRDHEG